MVSLNNSILPAFAVEVGLITYRSVVRKGPNVARLPLPSNYVAAVALFGVLALPQGEAKRPATLAAWAFVLATYFGVMDALPVSTGNLFNGQAGTAAGPAVAQGQPPQSVNAATSGRKGTP